MITTGDPVNGSLVVPLHRAPGGVDPASGVRTPGNSALLVFHLPIRPLPNEVVTVTCATIGPVLLSSGRLVFNASNFDNLTVRAVVGKSKPTLVLRGRGHVVDDVATTWPRSALLWLCALRQAGDAATVSMRITSILQFGNSVDPPEPFRVSCHATSDGPPDRVYGVAAVRLVTGTVTASVFPVLQGLCWFHDPTQYQSSTAPTIPSLCCLTCRSCVPTPLPALRARYRRAAPD